MTDDTEHDDEEYMSALDTPSVKAVYDDMMATFLDSSHRHNIDMSDAVIVMGAAFSRVAAAAFESIDPDTPVTERPVEERFEHQQNFLDLVEVNLAELLDLPVDISVEDDEEVNAVMDLMPGMSKFH